ncbi:MAG TPA: hypothetical protein VEB66_03280 [Opitutaceae bacterium]|nr:hypothetical protein [Opitutaceae bacterium]
MLYYLLAAGIVLHAFFWGAGLAWLAVPRPWRRWWWACAPALGLALQSAVVWAGAHLGLEGARAYAWPSEALPVALLATAVARAAAGSPWRRLRDLRGAAGALLVLLIAGWLLLSPMAAASRGLTSSSLGSVDQADHAAGARVLQEFARDARVGFLDQPEVTEVLGVKSFYDHRLKLASFLPAAVIAHDGVLFGVEPRRMIGITAAALVLAQLPLFIVLGRALAGLRGVILLGGTAVLGCSPLAAYAVHHGALAPLAAASGIGLVTLALFGLGRAAFAGRNPWTWLPLLLAALWIVAASDAALLPWSVAPGGLALLLESLFRRRLSALGRALVVVGVAAELLAVFGWDRLDGLILRWGAGGAIAGGWTMPLLTPEAWLGFVTDIGLTPGSRGMRTALLLALGTGWIMGLLAAADDRPSGRALAGFSLVGGALAGWGALAADADEAPRAAFDAWRFATAFLPAIVAGGLVGCAAWSRGATGRRFAVAVVALLVAANLVAADRFRRRMANPPLRVDRTVVELGALEADARVGSLNLQIEDPWARLWANTFLLRKPQYFPVHQYEARRATPLRGEWDLSDSQLWVRPAGKDDFIAVNRRFHAVRVAAPDRLEAGFTASGWYQEERGGDRIWRWSDGSGAIDLHNPRPRPQRAALRLLIRAAQPCTVRIALDGRELAVRALGSETEAVEIPEIVVPPGRTRLALTADRPPVSPPGDGRRLALALYEFELELSGP